MIRRVIIIRITIIRNLVEWLLAKNKIRHNLIISDSDIHLNIKKRWVRWS